MSPSTFLVVGPARLACVYTLAYTGPHMHAHTTTHKYTHVRALFTILSRSRWAFPLGTECLPLRSCQQLRACCPPYTGEARACMHTHKYTHIHTNTHTHTKTHTHTHTHTYTHTHIHTHTRTHTHKYTHRHAAMHALQWM